MNWDDVKLVLAVARTGSLNQAATLLDVNQSTVSRRLTGLEADLAVTLFRRSHQGLVATETGAAFVARAAGIEAQTESLIEAMRQTDERPAGIVRLLGNQWVVEHLLRSGLAEFLAEFPNVQLRTIAGRPQTSLWRGEPGIGLWFEAPPVDDAFSIRLGEVPYAIYGAQGAASTDWVAFHDEQNPESLAGLAAVRQFDPGARLRLTALDASTLREAIAAGTGRGLLPMCLAVGDPRLERIGSGTPELVRVLHFHAHPDTLGSPRVEVLLSWLRAGFSRIFLSDGVPPAPGPGPTLP